MAADPFLSAFAEKFVDCLYNAGSRQLGYLLHYDYNIRKLSRQDQDLKNKKERLQGKINDAQTKGEIIFEDVQQWIADVDRMTIEVGKFFDDENKANKKCLKGWCINFRSCYRFSKEALRKIEEISLLLAKVGDFEAVSHPDPTPRTLSLAKGSSDAYESRRSLKKQVMEALNDKNVSVIGICDRTKLGELPQGIVSGLKKLELLYMAIGSKRLDFEQGGDSSSNASKKLDFEQGDSSSNARVTELQALSKLTSLHIHIPGIRALPSDMPFQKLTNFVIGIGKSTAYNSCPSSRTLSLSDSMTPQVDWFKNLMKKTENLYLCRIKGLKVVSPDFDDVGFNKLKSLTLTECEEITYLLNTSKQIPDDKVFHNIEQLSLFSNPKLVEICKGELPDKSWSKLKAIDVNACHSMPSIVTSHFLQRLQSLERIQAVNCEKVVYAFDFKELVIAKEETYKLLPMLQTLELTMLTKMEQVWKGDSQFMSLCNLKRLKLDYCLELKKLFSPALQQTLLSLEHLEVICCYKLEEIFGKKETAVSQEAQATASPSLGKLRFILMKSCTQLKTLFAPSIVESLVQLRTLKVQSCKTMKEVIADEEGEGAAIKKRIVFPNLYEIHLEKLDSLICFCHGMYTEFPALEILRIDECPKMKMFGYGDQITPKLKKVLQGTKEHWFGSLNLTVQQLFKE
ncbi:hypothetical protein LWI28_002566 [Acer negundo]|uniref:Disease resistance protein At4g27190-like leucine-rich repeats domain-containing protein n=1 Tax=Acer negundo TaxID=4023 RepID=A0AAD5ITK8_ACENE|nr:hypothetical protein LWI28_002566 [Acer negundo]